MSSTELTRVASIFNEKIYKEISTLLVDFPWETDVAKLIGNTVLNNGPDLSVDAIKALVSEKLIPTEIEPLVLNIEKYRKIDTVEDIRIISNSIFSYYQTRKLQKAIDKYAINNNIPELIKTVKDIPEEFNPEVTIKTLGDLDPEEVRNRELGGENNILPTTLNVIKESTPYGGYLPGQVVAVTAPPGVGKSAFMLQEIICQAVNGYSILMIVLGDLMEYDIITRYTAFLTKTKYYEVALSPEKYFTDDVKEVARNIDIIVTPSKSMTSQKILETVKNSKKRYDVVVVDYDSNVKTTSDNMYDAGGELYDKLTEIARPKDQPSRLVFVACQPKIQFWDYEELPEEALGESSRKQHNIDIMITIGKAHTQPGKRAGIIALPKVRRGTAGLKAYYSVSESGEFTEINASVYKASKTYVG